MASSRVAPTVLGHISGAMSGSPFSVIDAMVGMVSPVTTVTSHP